MRSESGMCTYLAISLFCQFHKGRLLGLCQRFARTHCSGRILLLPSSGGQNNTIDGHFQCVAHILSHRKGWSARLGLAPCVEYVVVPGRCEGLRLVQLAGSIHLVPIYPYSNTDGCIRNRIKGWNFGISLRCATI